MREFKVGDKVKIPKTKSKELMTSLENCSAVQHAKKLNQNFLYINRIIEDQYYLGAELGRLDSAFGIQDLEHYEEFVLPKCWFVLYSNREEFDIIDKFYDKGWFYYDNGDRCGYHNNGDGQFNSNNWVGDFTTKERLLRKGYIQITFEQFQKYVLKQETMEKEIVGYKLVKPEYEEVALKITGMSNQHWNGFSTNKFLKTEEWFCVDYEKYVAKLKEAGVLDLWFEPVYEEEPKVGDWVTFEVNRCVGNLSRLKTQHWDRNITVPIDFITEDSFKFNGDTMNKYAPHAYWSGASNNKEVFRKATPEEIEAAKAAQKTIVKIHSSNKGMFEIEVVAGKAYYRPNNKELPKEWIKRIISAFETDTLSTGPYTIVKETKEINVGCFRGITKEDLQKLYALLK